MTTPATPATLTPEAASLVVGGFRGLAFSRSAVRLSAADYGFRRGATPAEYAAALEAYRGDRNQIRRASRELAKAFALLSYQFREESRHADLAAALIEASRGTRFEYLGGERGYSNYGQSWHYTAGQYQPTEIRRAAADLLRRAYRIYSATK